MYKVNPIYEMEFVYIRQMISPQRELRVIAY